MQGRSWMAALTLTTSTFLGLVLGFGPPIASRADDAKPTPATATTPEAPPTTSRVQLNLDIAGLGPKGCDVEIAPGHMGCQFRPVSFHLSRQEANSKKILFEDIQATSSDRYCIFAITIREPGQPVKTIRRGLRLVAQSSQPAPSQVLFCYLSSPSKLAKASEMRERR